MFFNKNTDKGLLREVSDSRQIVYDFRRRSHDLFENYRAIGYKKPALYDLEKMKSENAEVLAKLIAAHAVDAGNDDCLIDQILGPIRSGIRYLDDQRLDHVDFYSRYGIKRKTDFQDLEGMVAFWEAKEKVMEKEHEITKMLWDSYCGYSLKEATEYEE